MEDNFNIYIYSDYANFCSSLAIECNNYGFSLTFFNDKDLKTILGSDDILIYKKTKEDSVKSFHRVDIKSGDTTAFISSDKLKYNNE